MKRLKSLFTIFACSAGATLPDLIIASAVGGTATLTVSTVFIKSVETQTHVYNMLQVDSLRQEMIAALNSDDAWTRTIATNGSMSCLSGNGQSCQTVAASADPHLVTEQSGSPFRLVNAHGGLIYDSTSSTGGMMRDARACNTFSSNSDSGNNECPFRYEMRWQAICPTSGACTQPIVKITAQLKHHPAAGVVRVNPENYLLTVYRMPPASCSFNGSPLLNGQSVTAYQNSSVPTGQTCVSQARTCVNGALSGSYAFASCSVQAPLSCLFNSQTVPSGGSVTAYLNSTVPFGSSCDSQVRSCTNGSLSGSHQFSTCSVGAPASCLFNGVTVAHGQNVTAFLNGAVPFGSSCSQQVRSCNNGVLSGSYNFASCSVGPASCLFDGQTVAHGQTVTAFQNSSVAAGQSCVSQARTCTNGVLSGSYNFASCNVGPANCTLAGQTVTHGQTITAYLNSSVPGGQVCQSQPRTCTDGALSGSYNFLTCNVGPLDCSFNGSPVIHGQSVQAFQSSAVPFGSTCTSQWRTCTNGILSGSYMNPNCTVGSPPPPSCTFNGSPVAHGQTVTAYQAGTVPSNGTCVSEQRTCNSGSLSGSYEYANCSQNPACMFNSRTIATGQSVFPVYSVDRVNYGQSCPAPQTRTCQTNGQMSGSGDYEACVVEDFCSATRIANFKNGIKSAATATLRHESAINWFYCTFNQREPEAAGKAFWMNHLTTFGITQQFYGYAMGSLISWEKCSVTTPGRTGDDLDSCSDNATTAVRNMFTHAFQRTTATPPQPAYDDAGVTFWADKWQNDPGLPVGGTNMFRHKANGLGIIFINSPEWQNRWNFDGKLW